MLKGLSLRPARRGDPYRHSDLLVRRPVELQVTGDYDTAPDIDVLAEGIERGLDELKRAAQPEPASSDAVEVDAEDLRPRRPRRASRRLDGRGESLVSENIPEHNGRPPATARRSREKRHRLGRPCAGDEPDLVDARPGRCGKACDGEHAASRGRVIDELSTCGQCPGRCLHRIRLRKRSGAARTSSPHRECDRCRGSHRGETVNARDCGIPPQSVRSSRCARGRSYRSSRRPRGVAVAAPGPVREDRLTPRGSARSSGNARLVSRQRAQPRRCTSMPSSFRSPQHAKVPREQRAPRTRCMSARLPHLLSAVQRLSKFAEGEPRPALDGAERNVHRAPDLTVRQAGPVRELDGLPLLDRELAHCLANALAAQFGNHLAPRVGKARLIG